MIGGSLISAIFGVATSLLIVARTSRHMVFSTSVVALVASFCIGREAFFLGLAIIVFLLAFQVFGLRRLSGIATIGGAIALGPVVLTKTPIALATLPLLVVADLRWAFCRKLPLLTLALLLSATLTYLSLGQSLTYLPLFVELQGEMVRGYSEAMAQKGPLAEAELITFLVVGALLGALIFRTEWGHEASRPKIEVVLLFLGLGVYWLLTFKDGFVRQDLYSLRSWQAVGFGAILYAVSRPWPRGLTNNGPATILVIGVALLIVIAPMRWATLDGPGNIFDQLGSVNYRKLFVQPPIQHWSSLFAYIADPRGWFAQADDEKAKAWARIRGCQPLPKLEGPVDIIPEGQKTVIANGLNYRPRPVFYEDRTYTPRLIEANRSFFESARAPEWLFFQPGSIDGRYPTLTEGALWPDFLRLYEPKRLEGDLLLLRRRAQPLSNLLGPPRHAIASVGEDIAITDKGSVFVKIVMKKTWVGHLLDLLYRAPGVTMIVKARDSEARYRLIPRMASSGFLLSPLVDNVRKYLALAYGSDEALEPFKIQSVRITLGRLGFLAYQSEVDIEFIPLLISPQSPSQVDAPVLRTPIATQATNISELPPFPELSSGPDRWDFIDGLSAEVVQGSAVVSGQSILRLIAAGANSRHALGARFGNLAAGGVYRVSAWIKAEPSARVMIEAHDAGDPHTGNPSNYGAAQFNLATRSVTNSTGDIVGNGVDKAADGWVRLWVDLRSQDGQIFVLIGLLEGPALECPNPRNQSVFNAAGQEATFGGFEISPPRFVGPILMTRPP
jgi:hypothetical protein